MLNLLVGIIIGGNLGVVIMALINVGGSIDKEDVKHK